MPLPLPIARPRIGSVTLSVVTSAFMLLLTNATFWQKGAAYFSGHEWQFAALGLAVFLLSVAALTAISVKYLIKPAFILLVMAAAAASYFTDTFGVLIDRDMIGNAAVTTSGEARNLLTADLGVHLLLFGVLPSACIAWVKVAHRSFGSKVAHNCAVIFPCLAGAIVLVGLNYAAFSSTFRERGDLMGSLNPGAPIVGAVKYAASLVKERDIVVQPLGTDARQTPRISGRARKALTIVVVGETARAANFSLDGYARETNPELKARGVLNFTNVSSCGTATAVSLPCMFSVYPRADYSDYKGLATQNLTDVLSHAGVTVDWFDNNTGSKGVADRVGYEFLPKTGDARHCSDGECRDAILVDRLKTYVADNKAGDNKAGDNAVVVLHMLGSHGPAYFERYPPEFERFKPACRTARFADCTNAAIVAAYDNTILYTDHVLSEIIDILKAEGPDVATAMIYMSDHGESLGENGLYLHGAPYFLAPETQTHVPFVAWLSDGYAKANRLDVACLAGERDRAFSHDNLFHTVLGMTDVTTSVYDAALDAFEPCRGAAGPIASDGKAEVRS